MKTVTLTLEQALTALHVAESDIEYSNHGDYPNYESVEELTHYLRRAELVQRLKNAINAAQE
jgi:hypothetical protein